MALGRIMADLFQEMGPLFDDVGEIVADVLTEVIKVTGSLIGADNVPVFFVALSIPFLLWLIKRWRARLKLETAPVGPMIPAMILGMIIGLATLGSWYMYWRSVAGGHLDESRMTAVAVAIGVPMVISFFLIRPDYSWQKRPLAIIAVGVALSVGVCIADLKIFL